MSLLVIDAAHAYWSAWHARSGVGDGPVDVAVSRLVRLKEACPASRVVVACDRPPYERAERSPAYKAHRANDAAGRDGLHNFLRRLKADGWLLVGAQGHEADDVCATLAREGHRRGVDVTIASGDKDLWCLLPIARVVTLDGVEVAADELAKRFGGIRPEQLPDLLTLTGDASDGIAGVEGIGTARAAQLLARYGTLDNVLAEEVWQPAFFEQEKRRKAKLGREADKAEKEGAEDATTRRALADELGREIGIAALVARVVAAREDVKMARSLVRLRDDLPLDMAMVFGLGAVERSEEHVDEDRRAFSGVALRAGASSEQGAAGRAADGDASRAVAEGVQGSASDEHGYRVGSAGDGSVPDVRSEAAGAEAGFSQPGEDAGRALTFCTRCLGDGHPGETCEQARDREQAAHVAALEMVPREPMAHGPGVVVTSANERREAAHTPGADVPPPTPRADIRIPDGAALSVYAGLISPRDVVQQPKEEIPQPMSTNPYNFTATDATRESILLRAGICGPTGSGKSKTSLIVGSRMVERLGLGPLFVIDSENKSALRYAYSPRSKQGFRFKHVPMPEDDYSPAAYMAALDYCESQGAGVIVIDSLSHAWNGINGVLEQVDDATAASRSKNTFSEGWKKMTPIHNRLIQRILASSAHVIFTLRAKTDWVIQENERGKREPMKVGLAPVQREGVDYEPDLFFDMTVPDNALIVSKSRCDRLTPGEVVRRPGAEFADVLIEWLEDSEPVKTPRTLGEALTFAVTNGIAAAEERSAERYKEAKRGLLAWCEDAGVSAARRDVAMAQFKERVAVVVPRAQEGAA